MATFDLSQYKAFKEQERIRREEIEKSRNGEGQSPQERVINDEDITSSK